MWLFCTRAEHVSILFKWVLSASKCAHECACAEHVSIACKQACTWVCKRRICENFVQVRPLFGKMEQTNGREAESWENKLMGEPGEWWTNLTRDTSKCIQVTRQTSPATHQSISGAIERVIGDHFLWIEYLVNTYLVNTSCIAREAEVDEYLSEECEEITIRLPTVNRRFIWRCSFVDRYCPFRCVQPSL